MDQCNDGNLNQIKALLTRYGFETKQIAISELVENWAAYYSVYWIRLAILEALYQGRYKAISVEHILDLWKRLGQPTYHFTHEFERFITGNLLIKDFSDHNHFQEEAVEEKPLPLEQCPPTPSNTIITLTPIKELVKKIVIPISVASDKLTCQNNHKPSSNNGNSHPVEVDNSTIDEPELEYRTSLKPEKTPSSINQFVPLSDSSDFYRKLRAVAHQQFQENQEN
ncbi:hypothetical protein [Crocosphaera watsonii]|uniref:Sll1939 protein n=1 Tax=Crocosphaera watsonii WH 0401 TaxID=555881 RepID=T2J188_CROWT|nr:hypothetical protein [Crocosphaera watsonii]CCQ59643.1 hypothetical protein CWATWH0401_3490 [Crocosphaera watsonii WH 0401]